VRSQVQPSSSRTRRRTETAGAGSGRAQGRAQRERLLDAVISLSAKLGSQAVSVAQISSEAGVSSATFYEQFENKEECLLAAYRAAAERLLAVKTPRAGAGGWTNAAEATLREFAEALQRDPDAGRLLFVDILSGGPGAREARGAAIRAFERRVQEFVDSTPAEGPTLDVPVTALLGATRSIIARSLRTYGESELPAFAPDGMAWVLSYSTTPGGRPWSTGPESLLATPAAKPALRRARRPPQRLPRGRHRLPPGVVARSHRTRIVYATADVMRTKGYQDTTVADIVSAAGISREVFYGHFTDKQDAFLQAQNHPTQYILERCATAYFRGGSWPERVWRLLDTLLAMITENPAISHLRLVECYAAGPQAIRRAEEITRAFTIFLEEGYGYRPEAQGLPKLTTQAIAGGVFEMIQRHAARSDFETLPALLPRLAYVCLAPFTGVPEAIDFVSAKMACEPRGERP
jgi:AcrR family transcriptional regulator